MFFSKDHLWLQPDGDQYRVGLTDFAQGELGEMAFVELPEIGKRVKADEPVCSVDSLKSTSDVYAPVSGEISDVNSTLSEKGMARLINSDPYGEGWIFVIRADRDDDVKQLMTSEAYEEFIAD